MAEPAEVVDAEVVDDTPVVPVPAASTAVVRRERRSEVLRPLAVDQLVESFHDYQEMLPRLLADSDYQDAGRGQRFVKKSGWRKIAAAFDLDVMLIANEVERDPSGSPLRARVVARAIAPSGRTMDGDGYSSVDEKRFRGNVDKIENDLRATAATRAKNRAIADLVGMGDVSAEEVSAGDPPTSDPGRPYGEPADANNARYAAQALVKLCGGDTAKADKQWKAMVAGLGGYMPAAAALAIRSVAKVASIQVTNMDDADIPWSTNYQPPEPVQEQMDVPDAEVVDAGPAPNATVEAKSEVDQLEDDCFELWSKIDGSEEKALRRVTEASGNVKQLRALKMAARQAIRRAQEQEVVGVVQ